MSILTADIPPGTLFVIALVLSAPGAILVATMIPKHLAEGDCHIAATV